MDPKTEQALKKYLEEENASKTMGYTREALAKGLSTVQEGIQAHAAEDRAAFARIDDGMRSQRIRTEGVETSISKLKDDVEANKDAIREVRYDLNDKIRGVRDEVVTGSHHIPSQALTPKSSTPSWIQELNKGAIGWIVKSFAIALAGGAGALIHYLTSK